jgi:hypothetical protein
MARKKSAKLPKRIAGVKIPKKLRKSGGKLIEAASTPAGRELIAAGLVAAGSALAAKARTARRRADDAPGDRLDPAERGAQMAGQIGATLGAAANAALDRLLGGAPAEAAGPDDALPKDTRAD